MSGKATDYTHGHKLQPMGPMPKELRPISRDAFIELMKKLEQYILYDNVSQEDNDAIEACKTLYSYAANEMTDTCFVPISPLWREEI